MRGEMPFFSIPELPVTDKQENGQVEYMVSADRWLNNGVAVDIPVQKYNWESYHSVVNQGNGATTPL